MSEEQNAVEPVAPVTSQHQVAIRTGSFRATGSGDTSGFGGLVSTVQMPGATSRPFGEWFDAAADDLERAVSTRGVQVADAIEHYIVDRGELTVVARKEHLLTVAQALRDEPSLRFEMLMGVNGVHWPQDAGRELQVNIQLVSLTHNRRVRLETFLADSDRHVSSVTSLWPNADWHERETYDFFGIIFDGHPALTRIAMPDDWQGHPQRKDYPLGGINVEFKGATTPPPSERRSY